MTQIATLPPVPADLDFPVYSREQVTAHLRAGYGQGTLLARNPVCRPYPNPEHWPASTEGQQIGDERLTGLEHWKPTPPEKYVNGWNGVQEGHGGVLHRVTVTTDCHDWALYALHPAWGETQVSLDNGSLWSPLPLRYLGSRGVKRAVLAMTTPSAALDRAALRASRTTELYAHVQASREDDRPEAETELHHLLNAWYRDVSHPQTLTALNEQHVWVDDRVRPAIMRLNQDGHRTTFCCQGDPEKGGAYVAADTLPQALLCAAFNAGLDVSTGILRDTAPAHLQASLNAAFLAILDDYVADSLDETGLKYRAAFDLPDLSAYTFTLYEIAEI